jgi:predicted secreted Zn-dependent protease
MPSLRRLAAFLLVLACAGLAASAPAEPPPSSGPLAGIPNLEVEYYKVSGSSVAEIRAAINRVRPRDPNDGVAVDALNRWYISWRWPGNGRGGCDLARTELRFTATLRMPRLINAQRTPRAVLARWQAYVAALERHEAGHLRHAYDNMGSVLRAIRASTCANANENGRAAVRVLAQWDILYDRATRHGFTQGAHFP